jgi:hypothetical protein
MLSGTLSRGELCLPAPSRTNTAMAPADTHSLITAKCSFSLDVHLWHDYRRTGAAFWADRPKQIRPPITPIAPGARARAPFRPHPSDRALLTDPGFIGEPHLHWLARRFRRQCRGHEISKAALKTTCSSGLLCGCCGRTDSRRNASLCNKMPDVCKRSAAYFAALSIDQHRVDRLRKRRAALAPILAGSVGQRFEYRAATAHAPRAIAAGVYARNGPGSG